MMVLKEKKIHLARLALAAPFSHKARTKLGVHKLSLLRQLSYAQATLTIDGKYLYFGNGKVAGSTIRQLLFFHQTGRYFEGPLKHTTDGLKFGIDYWRDFKSQELHQGCFVFSFVREPEARLRSCYFNKVVDPKNQVRNPHMNGLMKIGFDPNANQSSNFARFVEYVAEEITSDPYYCDHHIRSQTVNLAYEEISYDFLGRFENFDQDIATVFKNSKDKHDVQSRIGKVWNNRSKSKILDISSDTRSIIHEIYDKDYSNFGYIKEQHSLPI